MYEKLQEAEGNPVALNPKLPRTPMTIRMGQPRLRPRPPAERHRAQGRASCTTEVIVLLGVWPEGVYQASWDLLR